MSLALFSPQNLDPVVPEVNHHGGCLRTPSLAAKLVLPSASACLCFKLA